MLTLLVAAAQLQSVHANAPLDFNALAFHTEVRIVTLQSAKATKSTRKFMTNKKDTEYDVYEMPAMSDGIHIKLLFLGNLNRRSPAPPPLSDPEGTYVAIGRPPIDRRISFVSPRNVGIPTPNLQPPVWVLTTRSNPDEFAALGLFPCLPDAKLQGSGILPKLAGALDPANPDSVEEITRLMLWTRINDLGREQAERAAFTLAGKAAQAQGYDRSRLLLTAVALGEWHRAEEALWSVVNAESDWQTKERAQILARVNLVPNTRDRTVRQVLSTGARNERLLEMAMEARTEPVVSLVVRNMNGSKPDAPNSELAAWLRHVAQFPSSQNQTLGLLASWFKEPDKRPVKGSDAAALLAYWQEKLSG